MNWKPGNESDSSDNLDEYFPLNEYYETATSHWIKKPMQEFGNKNKGDIASAKAISHKTQTVREKGGDISSTTSSRKHKGGIPSTINVRDSDRNTASMSNSRVPKKTFLDKKHVNIKVIVSEVNLTLCLNLIYLRRSILLLKHGMQVVLSYVVMPTQPLFYI